MGDPVRSSRELSLPSAAPGNHPEITAPSPAEGAADAESTGLPAAPWGPVFPALAICLFYSGLIMGWAPLQLLLEKDAVYANLCSPSDPQWPDCDARLSRLVFLFTTGSTAGLLASLPCGIIVDHLGPMMSCTIGGSVLVVGLLLFGFTSPSSTSILDGFLVASVLIGLGSCFVQLSTLPLAFVVEPSQVAWVLSAANCFFDASSAVPEGLFALYSKAALSRRCVFGGFAVLCALMHGALVLGWSGAPIAQLRAAKKSEEEARRVTCGVDARTSLTEAETPAAEGARPRLHGLRIRQQLRSFEFFFASVHICLQMTRSNAYLGVNKEQLEGLGDAQTGYTYTQLFSACLPLAVVFVPVVSSCMQRRGFGDSFLVTAVLGLTWNTIGLIPVLPIQVLNFVSFTSFRAFLYSTHFAYMAHTFGSQTSATVHGLITLVASALNFLVWPFTNLSLKIGQGKMTFFMLGLLAMGSPPVCLSLMLRRRLDGHPEADCRVSPAPRSEDQVEPGEFELSPRAASRGNA